MFNGLFIASLIGSCVRGIKEAFEPTLTAEHWANKELHHKDIMSGMSEKDIIKSAERGRYFIPKEIAQAYPVPHKDSKTGKNIIENDELWKNDLREFGASQTYKWVEQGKYNLNAAELEITHLQFELKHLRLNTTGSSYNRDKEKARMEEIKEILATKSWDCRNTEALKQWQKAHDAESKFNELKLKEK